VLVEDDNIDMKKSRRPGKKGKEKEDATPAPAAEPSLGITEETERAFFLPPFWEIVELNWVCTQKLGLGCLFLLTLANFAECWTSQRHQETSRCYRSTSSPNVLLIRMPYCRLCRIRA